ncbi:uncharacterized protein [Halyomorpha halys]|uniref:uncharacterized protein n=1 Tax=Halyomorpha halys TaxID=286706 RepID=UPI0006D4EF1E|nr:uncharacterized protein LOC106688725 [Halyomorpha halys]
MGAFFSPKGILGSDDSGPLEHLHSFDSHGSLLSDHEPKYIVQQSAPATKQALPVPGALENIKSCESCKHLVMTPSIANIRKKSYLPRKNIVKKDATAQTSRTMFTFAGSSARDHSASSKLEKRLSTEVPQTSAQNLQGTVQPNTAATNVAPDHSASSRTSTEVPQTSAQNVQGTLQPNTPATNADVASTRSGNISSSESFRRLRLTTAYKLRMALEKIKGKSADKK